MAKQPIILVLIITAMLLSSCAKHAPDKAWLDILEGNLTRIDYGYSVADWEFYTTGEAPEKLDYFQQQWSEIMLDSATFARIKSLRNVFDDPMYSRRVELLYRLFLSEQVGARPDIYKLVDSLSVYLNNFRATFEGQERTDNYLLDILRYDDNRMRRRQAYYARAQLGAIIADGVAELARRRNAFARKQGFENFYQLKLYIEGIDEGFRLTLAKLDSLTQQPYNDLIKRLKKRLKIQRFEPWDNYYAFGDISKLLKPYFPKDRAFDILKTSMAGIGFGLDSLRITYDIEPRPGKSQHAYSFSIRIPVDIRILANIQDGYSSYYTLFHETGHALNACFIRQPGYILKSSSPGWFAEGMAVICEELISQPRWLRKYLSIPDSLIAQRLRSKHEASIIGVRRTLVNLYFEKELFENPDRDLTELYWELNNRLLGWQKYNDCHIWASIIHFTTHPVYLQNYLLADIVQSHVYAFIEKELGPVVDNPQVGAFLVENCYKPGASRDWNKLIEQATGEPLNPRYYVEYLLQQ